ncbi:MAG TPA: MBOAT family O-acyltransferase [Planctomycetota bacterium]|nr:MBOAT family O-acyltransferase [Planctomycetota bacterium]
MLFNSLSYALFLWTVFVLWWALRNRRPLRHAMVLAASLWFYSLAPTAVVWLLVGTTLVEYVTGGRIHLARQAGKPQLAKRWLWVSLAVNLGTLAVFKYFDFFSESVQQTLHGFGIEVSTVRLGLMLPLGISFFTFQTLSYSLDIYKGYLKPTRTLLDFATYSAFFPQLVAGPIVRATDFLPQMEAPAPPTRERIGRGLYQILQGLSKKLLLADVLGSTLVDPVLRDPEALARLDAAAVLLLGLGFMIQLYGDFAGYSDIAIGSARLLGFDLRMNFNSPLRSATVEEFWRRWHISMSTWFRDYLFAPLAGRRPSLVRLQVATFLTFVIVGLWHGATWTFIAFGAIHGAVLVGARLFRKWTDEAAFRKAPWWWWTCFLSTLVFVCLTSLLYRSPDVGDWLLIMRGLGNWSLHGLSLPWQVWLILATGVATHMLPQARVDRVERAFVALPAALQATLFVAAMLLFFGLRPPGASPFIYFQF